MTRYLRTLLSLFTRRRPIVVNHYRVSKRKADRELQKTTAQLAREMGKPNPLGGA